MNVNKTMYRWHDLNVSFIYLMFFLKTYLFIFERKIYRKKRRNRDRDLPSASVIRNGWTVRTGLVWQQDPGIPSGSPLWVLEPKDLAQLLLFSQAYYGGSYQKWNSQDWNWAQMGCRHHRWMLNLLCQDTGPFYLSLWAGLV